MLVLAMQFSRSSGTDDSGPGHEDAGAATGWPGRRSLEGLAARGRSLKTEDRTVRLEQVPPPRGDTYDRRRRPDRTERGSNWESFLR
jgi:hypothetical protein